MASDKYVKAFSSLIRESAYIATIRILASSSLRYFASFSESVLSDNNAIDAAAASGTLISLLVR